VIIEKNPENLLSLKEKHATAEKIFQKKTKFFQKT